MTTPGSEYENDHDLIAAYLEGDLSERALAAFNDRLASDPAFADAFTAQAHLHTALRRAHTPNRAHKPDAERERGVGIPAAPAQSAIGNRQSKISPRPIPFIIYPISIAAAALLTAAIVVVYLLAFNTDPQPDPIQPDQPGPAVATLIENTGDLRTPHGYPAEGEDFSAGEYALTSGTAEFMLTNAVNVKLRGNTRMLMRDDMNVSLAGGSAEFVCPADAKGFTVHLPNGARVVDLGTRFTVTVDDEGTRWVAVTDGTVEVFDGIDPVGERLSVGHAVRISPDGAVSWHDTDTAIASNADATAIDRFLVFGNRHAGDASVADSDLGTVLSAQADRDNGYAARYVSEQHVPAIDDRKLRVVWRIRGVRGFARVGFGVQTTQDFKWGPSSLTALFTVDKGFGDQPRHTARVVVVTPAGQQNLADPRRHRPEGFKETAQLILEIDRTGWSIASPELGIDRRGDFSHDTDEFHALLTTPLFIQCFGQTHGTERATIELIEIRTTYVSEPTTAKSSQHVDADGDD